MAKRLERNGEREVARHRHQVARACVLFTHFRTSAVFTFLCTRCVTNNIHILNTQTIGSFVPTKQLDFLRLTLVHSFPPNMPAHLKCGYKSLLRLAYVQPITHAVETKQLGPAEGGHITVSARLPLTIFWMKLNSISRIKPQFNFWLLPNKLPAFPIATNRASVSTSKVPAFEAFFFNAYDYYYF